MKRWVWLLVLPWSVVVSSDKFSDYYRIAYVIGGENWVEAEHPCPLPKEACQDIADALNEAHRRRLNPPTMKMFEMKTTPN